MLFYNLLPYKLSTCVDFAKLFLRSLKEIIRNQPVVAITKLSEISTLIFYYNTFMWHLKYCLKSIAF